MANATVKTIQTSATPDDVYAVAADIAGYPAWATGVSEAEVLEWDGDGRVARARFDVDAVVRRITYVLNYAYDEPYRIAWVAEEGKDIKEMEGHYEFTELEDGGTEILYSLSVTPGFSLPGLLRRRAERQIINSALRDLKKHVEQTG